MVAQDRFRTTGFCSLRKSHTHCRIGPLSHLGCNQSFLYCFFTCRSVSGMFSFLEAPSQDQCWGIISRCKANIQDATDVVRVVRNELCKSSILDWVDSTTHVQVQKLNTSRDWRQHLPSLGVKLEGGLLKDDTGNHYFFNMQRRGEGCINTCFTIEFFTLPYPPHQSVHVNSSALGRCSAFVHRQHQQELVPGGEVASGYDLLHQKVYQRQHSGTASFIGDDPWSIFTL